jgi:hypothetical protein
LPVKDINNWPMEQTDTTFIKKAYSQEEKQEPIESWKQSGKSRMAFSIG